MFPLDTGTATEKEPGKFMWELVDAMNSAHDTARSKLRTTLGRMKRDNDVKLYTRSFKLGDLVYILDSSVAKGTSSKLHKPWKGPGIIVTCLTPYLYRVKLKSTISTVNHDRLKLCKDRSLPPWLTKYLKVCEESKSNVPDTQPDDQTDTRDIVYCYCRKPYRGNFLICCDGCTEWFHGACVNVTETDAKSIRDLYCPTCQNSATDNTNSTDKD
jgi:hypothetical protein